MVVGRFLRSVFLALALLHVAGLQQGWTATAWTGSAALATLTLVALLPPPVAGGAPGGARLPRHAVRLALAALTAAALLLDARHDGRGWPTALAGAAGPGDWGPVEAALLAVAGSATAVAAIGAVGLPRSWWRRLLPAVGGVLAGVAAGIGPAVSQEAGSHPAYLTAAVTPLLGAAVLLGVAAGTVVAARRGAAGAGLAALACFLLVPLSGVLDDPRVARPVVREEVTFHAGVTIFAYDSTRDSAGVAVGEPGRRYGYPDGTLWSTTYLTDVDVVPAPPELQKPQVAQEPPPPGDFWTAEPHWRGSVWATAALVLALLIAMPRFVAVGDDPEPTS